MMNGIKETLELLKNQKISVEEAEKLLKANFIEEVGDLAKLDVNRHVRTGIPEVIYAKNKEKNILINIVKSFLEKKQFAVISRYNEEQKQYLMETFSGKTDLEMEINDLAKTMVIKTKTFSFPEKKGIIGIITAGSSDIPVAEEAKTIAKIMGCRVLTSYDIGIAGIHRLFKPLSTMIKKGVHVIIVCAGMEGTLPGVVSALVDVPVIGVPISSGYGIGADGKGALITMLQSCSPGLLVVNIDNGFGAGASAALIANKIGK
ncbi:MAG: nickel pincer cofactor biosynthesis protein LarB [Promethearchaeota archaeon]